MGFNMADFFNAETKKEIKSDWKPIRISVHKLKPAAGKENFYHMDDKEIEETARTIELVGLQQYPVVKPVGGTDEYEIIAGHKRRLAVLKLLSEGKTEYEMIPCKVEGAEDSIKNRLILIFTNSTQRERTDFEKMQEIKEVKELLTEWKKGNKLPDKMQNVIAEILGTNKTKVGTLENIDKNLIAPFMEEYAAGNISTNAANEIAGLEQDAQQALYETYRETGSLIAKDAKALKEDSEEEQIKGQQNIFQFPDYLPDNLQAEAREYAQTTGVSIEEAARIVYEKQQRAQEPEKEQQPKESTPEPVKGQETAQNAPTTSFMNEPEEPETKVTYNQPTPDKTDRKSLIINGKINLNKEYNGMKVNYFMGAVINSDLFDTDFWTGWKRYSTNETFNNPKAAYMGEYAGTKTTYIVQTTETEKCEAVLLDDGLEVCRIAADQRAFISYEELADLIDLMIYTKVIEIKEIKSDLKYWARQTAKDLLSFSNYLTESEIYVLQDLMMRCKERAGM